MFLTEPEPVRGVAQQMLPGVRRIVADNPGPMTYQGTNTYLIETPDGIMVLDPGPDSSAHVDAILAATGGRVARILISHTHRDHRGATAALKAATGAPTYGWRQNAEPGFAADVGLGDGDAIGGMVALHTPGHAADHLCFATSGGVLFSGDHVMPWSTSVVSPPGGDMAAYFASLRLLLQRDDRVYLSGHGPLLEQPLPYVRALLAHRIAREEAIAALLRHEPASARQIMETVYPGLNPLLGRAAERNVLAHLMKLEAEGRVGRDGEVWRAA